MIVKFATTKKMKSFYDTIMVDQLSLPPDHNFHFALFSHCFLSYEIQIDFIEPSMNNGFLLITLRLTPLRGVLN